MVDVVITYVDGNDPLWQADYAAVNGGKPLVKRYRDWGTLPYLLRGIREFMPFVDNVYLLVSRESQIPSWADTQRLNIVCHRDIMPASCLPTFNSASIELFLHRIPGLKERYIYFNDDNFPVSMMKEEDFFIDGKAVSGYSNCILALNVFKKHTRGSDRFARKAAGMSSSLFFKRPQHSCAPMLRSLCEELYDAHTDEIIATATPLRRSCNLNQYVYRDYALFKGVAVNRRISNKHISMASSSAEKIKRFLASPTANLVCINDVQMSDEKAAVLHEAIHKSFGLMFPKKSEFEK